MSNPQSQDKNSAFKELAKSFGQRTFDERVYGAALDALGLSELEVCYGTRIKGNTMSVLGDSWIFLRQMCKIPFIDAVITSSTYDIGWKDGIGKYNPDIQIMQTIGR